MKKITFTLFFCALCVVTLAGQDMTSMLYETYGRYKETTLTKRRVKHSQILTLINGFKNNPKFEINRVGESIEGRELNLISMGTGEIDVFLWSQMHGDEPTATQAIFDIFNFFKAQEFKTEKEAMLKNLRLHFLPMLNPDGAELYQRRNSLGVDINRDAIRLQSPESRVLKRVRDSIDPPFGFNLHDQSRYYNADRTSKPATISYLAPAFNYEKDINEVRARGMQVIVFMNNIIQNYAKGQVGRYSDAFEPRAFGDNFMKWGTSSILIESGGYADDREKQEIRKLNYVSILSALYTIANESYKDIALEDYEKIPRNDRKLFDLKLKNLTYELNGEDYILDLGIQRQEVDNKHHDDFHYKSLVVDQGDLSTYYGYETFDASGYKIVPPKKSKLPKGEFIYFDLLKKGYAYIDIPKNSATVVLKEKNEIPLHFWNPNLEFPDFQLEPGVNPTFFLEKEGELTHALINGFLLDLSQPLENQKFENALIYK